MTLVDFFKNIEIAHRRVLRISRLLREEKELCLYGDEDGTKVVRKKGIALFRYGKKVGGPGAIFDEEGDSKLLGALTLQALGLVIPGRAS